MSSGVTTSTDLLRGLSVTNEISFASKMKLIAGVGLLTIMNQGKTALAKLRVATPADDTDRDQVTTVGYVVDKLDALTTAVQSAIGGISGDVSTLQADVGTLNATVGTLNTTVTDLASDVDGAQSAINSLQTDVTSVQGDVSSLQTNVSSLQTDVSNLQNASAMTGAIFATSVSTTTTTAESADTIASGKEVIEVIVEVTTAYDNGATLEVGFGTAVNALLDNNDVDLSVLGSNTITVPYTLLGADKLKATINGSPTTGACKVYAKWIN